MVYNRTSCSLNNILWAPCFGLPTVKQTLQALLLGYFQCDQDVGEQFLNCPLHSALREFLGVDVSGVQSAKPGDTQGEEQQGPHTWEWWERNWMGLQDSPYWSLQWQVRLKYEVYGDRRELANSFHWDRVVFNLPGSKGYRSDLPWVMKIRADGHLVVETSYMLMTGGQWATTRSSRGRRCGPTELAVPGVAYRTRPGRELCP